jgi:glycine/D-amino acid oxidase-like deaminating enzyme
MQRFDTGIIGAGIAGISTAYFLTESGVNPVALIEPGQPMGLTSAQSGDNYRNWWPHPVMTRFTDDSIDLMERLARDSGNRINMTRRGYALATRRRQIDDLIEDLHRGYGESADRLIRHHSAGHSSAYQPAVSDDWNAAPDGVDVIQDPVRIRESFPSFDPEVSSVVHVRRAGDISGQQLGQIMLERFRDAGGARVAASVTGIDAVGDGFSLRLDTGDTIQATRIVNAAGPVVGEIGAMIGQTLPVTTVLQQKIAFEDTAGAIPRDMPFAIDLDTQHINWTAEERDLLGESEATRWLTGSTPGGVHCRPDGGLKGRWVKLGWAYNTSASAPSRTPLLDDSFPDIVLRGAARLNPALKPYYGRLPRNRIHYGGYYTMTEENWPLIGPTDTTGVFVVGTLSGFGTMAACQAGRLCADWIVDGGVPDYGSSLSLARYKDAALMRGLRDQSSRGIL